MIRRSILTFALFGLLSSCTKPLPPVEGFVPVPGGKIYYAQMGNGPGVPLIVIHGGPGSGSYGSKPFGALGDERPVIRYDQLGAGKADHPTDTTLFTVERAVLELQALRDSLGLAEVHLLGQSWGAMLLQAYMGSHPTGVKSVTFLSPLVTTAQWEQAADSLIKTLPDSMQRAISDGLLARMDLPAGLVSRRGFRAIVSVTADSRWKRGLRTGPQY
jgi:proline-specific peptidase